MEDKTIKYEVQLITEDDVEAVLEHLRTFFFRIEPLNEYIKLVEFEDSTCIELEDFCTKSIEDKTSLMAVAPSGKIIGVCLNGESTLEHETDGKECANEKFAKILRLLDHFSNITAPIIQERFPGPNKILNVKILSTDTEWQGHGIARVLMDKSRKIAHEQGYNLMRVDCSSYFSARAISKLGFECIYELKFEDYKEDGEVVFKPAAPHTSMTVYVQKISSD